MSPRRLALAAAAALSCTALLAACGSNPPQADGAVSKKTAAAAGSQLTEDKELHDQLPEKARKSGKLVSVNNGSFPPYEIAGSDGHSLTGASADLSAALGKVLGVTIEHVTADGLPSELTGIKAGRYDFAIGPIGDFKERQGANDFVDWVQEFVVFAVPKGNPKGITSLDTACGRKVAVMAGGSAEGVIKKQSEACTKKGKAAVQVQSYKDQPSSILAVKSGRADAFFSSQAPLTYFVQQSKGELELAGTGQSNGFDDLYQGAVVPKDGPLRDVLLKAIQKLIDNGTYDQVMAKWGLKDNELKKAGVNLAKS
ncbi:MULTISPECIES: ABC transporter substrate-binding protein [Streptomyces]|uniref:ABC transporter substrate-binding protein n=1 Tax=Streptomyces lonegramiae TaxID=3075524 RepID=A0ABU2X7I2_9ACTN|nr:ABC transporter substrate-binding protein [Streptomyces sp. DSM 41529]MDT0541879.1 ABC transporter substrate-binding protein [Streptomyces sp. DSM 41529]